MNGVIGRGMVSVVTVIALAAATGCGVINLGPSGRLAVQSQTQSGVSITGGFDSSYYSLDDNNNLTVLLFDGPPESPEQVALIQMFWKPRAGRTPIDETATNATVHYLIFTGQDNEQVGIYSGAGFFYPRSKLGGSRLSADVWQANLRLVDRSEHFRDLLGQAMLEGKLAARRDDVTVTRLRRQLNVMVRQRLGYPRMVSATR